MKVLLLLVTVLAAAYAAGGYMFFWYVINRMKPGRVHGPEMIAALIALFFGPLLIGYQLVRQTLDPRHRPMHVTFFELEYDPDTKGFRHEGTYETVWRPAD